MGRVAACVDGFNLYYGMRAKYGRRYLWLDVVDLVRRLRPHDEIESVHYFTALVKGEPAALANQIVYLEALAAHNGSDLTIHRGWFKDRSNHPCRRCGQYWRCGCTPPRNLKTWEEKGTDVALGVTLLAQAVAGKADLLMLVSADSDFAPAVAAVKRFAPTLPVYLAMPPGNVKASQRFQGVGSFSINETALRRAQLPEVVTDLRSGAVYGRPKKWS